MELVDSERAVCAGGTGVDFLHLDGLFDGVRTIAHLPCAGRVTGWL